MALQKQNITIPLGLGINTKVDSKLVEAGTFNLVCENATFDKVGAVKKRQSYKDFGNGTYYTRSSTSGTGTGSFGNLTYKPIMLAGYGDSALLRSINGDYYQRFGAGWSKKDNPITECVVDSEVVYTSGVRIANTDTAYDATNDIVLIAGRELTVSGGSGTRDGAVLVLYDRAKKASITCERIPGTNNGTEFGAVRCGYSVLNATVYYHLVAIRDDETMVIYTFDRHGQKTSTTFTQSGFSTSNTIAVVSDSNFLYIMAPTSTGGTWRFIKYQQNTAAVNTTFSFGAGTIWTSSSCTYSSGSLYLIGSIGTTVYSCVLSLAGTVTTPSVALTGANMGACEWLYGSTTTIYGIDTSVGAVKWVSNTQTIENRNSGPATSYITLGATTFGVHIMAERLNQTTFIAMENASTAAEAGKRVIARMESGLGGAMAGYNLARFAYVSSTEAYVALPKYTSFNAFRECFSIQIIRFQINPNYNSWNRAQVGPSLHLQGGFVAEYDGEQLMENGFHFAANYPSLDSSVAGGLTGTYNYKILYKYVDKNGQVTKSEPSASVSTGAITSKRVTLSVTAQPFGIRAANCIAEIYRTTNGGTVFYKVGETVVNMYSAATITLYTDNETDATITDNEQIYTTGGVLENNPAPACKVLCQGGNRLFLGGLVDKYEIAYSKKKLFGEAVAFNDAFRIRFDTAQFNTIGGITAIGYMDDKLIIFKENSIFYVTGDGPNELGADDTFTPPEIVSTDTGCTESRSVVLTPLGLMFKGAKGIYLLSRALEVVYVGQEVEEFNSYNVTSSVHVSEKNQVLFTLRDSNSDNKNILAFDYFTKQWSVTTGWRVLDSDVVSGDHCLIDSTPAIKKQDGSNFIDNDGALYYTQKVKTPWIKVSGIQDFGRVWSATILGKYKSAHSLIVKVYYDYVESTSTTYTISPSINDSQYQYKIHLGKQKCEAIQFEIYDSGQSGTGESMELTALTLEVGVKSGSYKLPASRKY